VNDAEEENGEAEEELRGWGRRERKEGLVVAHGALDEVLLFRKNGNVACCDITEDVGLGVSTSRDSVTRTMVFE